METDLRLATGVVSMLLQLCCKFEVIGHLTKLFQSLRGDVVLSLCDLGDFITLLSSAQAADINKLQTSALCVLSKYRLFSLSFSLKVKGNSDNNALRG